MQQVDHEPTMYPCSKEGQQHPGLYERECYQQMEGREWWSLPSTQHWQDIAGILGPVLSFPVNERNRHTKGNRAKGYWNDAGFEAGESWKLWDSSTFMILWYNLSIERMSLSEHNTGMCPCTDASFYTSPSFLFILLFSPQVGSYSLKLWTPMNVKDILPGMLHILSWALNLNNRWPLVHFHGTRSCLLSIWKCLFMWNIFVIVSTPTEIPWYSFWFPDSYPWNSF